MMARSIVESETPGLEQIWVTQQGTDAHLLPGTIGQLREGLSYQVQGIVGDGPTTGTGGHVSFQIRDGNAEVRCMAYEPTKNFRDRVRELVPGDAVIACGSYKKGSINLEKIKIITLVKAISIRPPICAACNKRMTSDGRDKGWKCKKCGARADGADIQEIPRTLKTGWYEVPPTARRHLAKPSCRGVPDF
jgi:tRNA(Ile2)-agmatinylcytidine synthase